MGKTYKTRPLFPERGGCYAGGNQRGSDMARYEYQVVPAPSKGTKAKGVKAPEARFSLTLQDLMNEKGAEGWEYQRAETLPSEERKGLTGSATNWRHVLILSLIHI